MNDRGTFKVNLNDLLPMPWLNFLWPPFIQWNVSWSIKKRIFCWPLLNYVLYIGFSIDHNFVLITGDNNLFLFFVFVDIFFFLAGLLLREIKDFWPVALLMATLLYPANVDYTQDLLNRHFELQKRKELFDVVYNEIVKLGIIPKAAKQITMKTSCFLIQSLTSNPSPRARPFPVAFQVWKMCGKWNLWWMGRRLWPFCSWKQEDHLLENGWVDFQVKAKDYNSDMSIKMENEGFDTDIEGSINISNI